MVTWAPLNIPLTRRLQTFAVLILLLSQLTTIWFFFVLFVVFPFPIILYIIWYMRYDKAPTNGVGRRKEVLRNAFFWKYFKDYFPLQLIKTADLDPSKTYIFGYHPHGIIGVGAFTTFATNVCGFDQKFPGIRNSLMTLAAQFYVPIWREFLLALGIAEVSRESCVNSLRQGPGSSITIVIGGANESLYSRPGTADLTLKNRKGFVKIALSEGACLVPVFAFGETDLWDQVPNPPGSWIRSIQDFMKHFITFTVPLIHGRGIFQYGFGLLPQRRPINVVVGKPIELPKLTPDLDTKAINDQVDKYHQIYMDELKKLYDTHKNEYAKNRRKSISFVE
eukprot:TRINITY_DN10579_c0_g1_i1.p1 TRINITY_DN10579_c0_g1~~TRINITY_DN10579_c0_g1_i1.p1  ORF type:complete len:336 (+),score=26.67 TRINITY_DN10579_c0_g1_i1:24-1031(+)